MERAEKDLEDIKRDMANLQRQGELFLMQHTGAATAIMGQENIAHALQIREKNWGWQ